MIVKGLQGFSFLRVIYTLVRRRLRDLAVGYFTIGGPRDKLNYEGVFKMGSPTGTLTHNLYLLVLQSRVSRPAPLFTTQCPCHIPLDFPLDSPLFGLQIPVLPL